MSLDISLKCECCGIELAEENITYNVSGIYYRAMRRVGIRGGFRGLDGRVLDDDLAAKLAEARAFTLRHRKRLRRYEPDNGWGSLNCVVRVLDMLLREHRDGRRGRIVVW